MTSLETVRVGDLVRVVGGGTPKRDEPSFYGGGIPWVTPKDMKSWDIKGAKVSLTQSGVDNSATKMIPAGSVLVVVRSGVLKHTVPVGLNRVPVAINQDMKALMPTGRADADYLARFIKARSMEILSWVRATTADNFPIEKLKDLEIALPTLAEQKRIAAVLDQVDTLRAKRREAITLLDDLAQSIFLDMFGDPVRNEKFWPVGKVADLVASFESGKSLAQGQDEGTKFRVLKVSAVTSGIFRPLESKPLPVAYEVPYGHLVRQGDLLFSRANTEELIGAVSLVEGHHENLALSDKLWRFVWHDSVDSHPLYVRHLFRQGEFRRQVRERSSGTSGSMKNISQANVLGIACGIPPIELRKEFSDRMQSVARLQTSHRLHLAALDELFESLQQRSFSGQLWDHEAA